jgi:nickel-dependent lactate racemase
MLAELHAAGVTADQVTLLVAVGTHRASTDAEKREKVGGAIVDRYRVIDHDAGDDAGLVRVLDGPGGVPFRINRLAAEADLLLSTGLVEPHQYAGYSGGGKTVAIGCADNATIAYTTGRPCSTNRNPLGAPGRQPLPRRGPAGRGGGRSGLRRQRRAGRIRAGRGDRLRRSRGGPGPPGRARRPALHGLYPAQVDIAVAGVGHPKDANLYQASRAASYLQFAPTPVVRRGGVLIVPAACPEGAGEGAGEQRFLAAMSRAGGPAAVIERARRDGIQPGEQRAYIMARVLEEATVIFAGIADPAVAESGRLPRRSRPNGGLGAGGRHRRHPARALVVPHALLTLPVVEESPLAVAS